MSINVTVSGNPVSIKRGKMVSIDSTASKEEFEKRRLIRLGQVREQSKDIAGDIRSKVHKEKIKQMKKIEEDGKEKLKEWKNRKMLELQSQYNEALKELGTGHKEAQNVEKEFSDFEKEKLQQRQVSLQRGREAVTNLQIENAQEILKKSVPLQCKKNARDIENTRANLISNMKNIKEKHKKRRKSQANISISIPDSSFETDQLTTEDSENVLINDIETSSQENIETFENPRKPLKEKDNIENNKVPESSINQEGFLQNEKTTSPQNPPLNTRISDRIKKRELQISQPDYCDTVINRDSAPYGVSNTKIRELINCRCKCCCLSCDKLHGAESDSDKKVSCTLCSCLQQQNVSVEPLIRMYQKQDRDTKNLESKKSDKLTEKWDLSQLSTEIPIKPSVRIKDVPYANELNEESKKYNKVQYYDHSNRFLLERDVPSSTYVEKLAKESTEVIPNIISENEILEEMNRKDKEALVRGKKALATERVKRDYDVMLKKLPLLQKKEKILELKKDKQEYHMPRDRLKEVERLRQNKLENSFNQIFPNAKPAVVTLPKVNRDLKNEIIEKKIDEPVQSLDLNKLDTCSVESKMFSVTEVQEIIRAFTQQQPADRRAKLKELLHSLKLQKDELIKEIQAISQPQDESINDLINDLKSFDNDDQLLSKPSKKKKEKKTNRKRRHIDNDLYTETTENSSGDSTGEQRSNKNNGSFKYKVPLKSTSTTRKRKSRHKPKVIILQNSSTQTTPLSKGQVGVTQQKIETKPLAEDHRPSKDICKKLHIPCDCKERVNPEELCRILINLDEDKSGVIVNSDKSANNNKKIENIKRVELKSVGVGTERLQVLPLKQKPTADISENTSVKNEEVLVQSVEPNKKKVKHNVAEKQVKTSWREHLSKNSISTSSTSYMSPPDIAKTKTVTRVSCTNKRSFYSLRDKPQQKNLSSSVISGVTKSGYEGTQKVNFQLVAYIEKLLGMSRASIENLNVSSTSSVTTPSQSLIELESNNANTHWQELLKQFTLKVGNIAEELSYSPSKSSLHFNTSISSSDGLQNQFEKQIIGDTDTVDQPDEITRNKPKETISQQYAKITDSCSKRISSLAAMIQQIRNEKIEMLQNPVPLDDQIKMKSPVQNDEEFSRVYMDLPEIKEVKTNQKSLSSSSTSLSTDEEEMLKKLLEVDLNLAKKLKPPNPGTDFGSRKVRADSENSNHLTAEFQKRLEGLLQTESFPNSKNIAYTRTAQKEEPFLSFLSDIPKLPKFEVEGTNEPLSNHKRPPPSKGLAIAKKFNENLSLMPHELSTIVEADSQLSTKIGNGHPSPTTPKTSLSLSPLKDVELIILPQTKKDQVSPNCLIETAEVKTATHSSNNSTQCSKNKVNSSNDSSIHSKSGMCESSCSKIFHSFGDLSKQSSSSTDDIETIEAMLKSIGMEWAIPTLHKIKETLALSSSSSSLDLTKKKKVFGNDSNTSDTSLKDLLWKHLYKKISSSTIFSDTSPVSILGERQRMSTPLTTSKNSSKSKERAVFSMESDISPVSNATN